MEGWAIFVIVMSCTLFLKGLVLAWYCVCVRKKSNRNYEAERRATEGEDHAHEMGPPVIYISTSNPRERVQVPPPLSPYSLYPQDNQVQIKQPKLATVEDLPPSYADAVISAGEHAQKN